MRLHKTHKLCVVATTVNIRRNIHNQRAETYVRLTLLDRNQPAFAVCARVWATMVFCAPDLIQRSLFILMGFFLSGCACVCLLRLHLNHSASLNTLFWRWEFSFNSYSDLGAFFTLIFLWFCAFSSYFFLLFLLLLHERALNVRAFIWVRVQLHCAPSAAASDTLNLILIFT